MQYTNKLDQLEKHFEELTAQMADPAVISDGEQYRKISKASQRSFRSNFEVSRLSGGVGPAGAGQGHAG